MRIWTLGCSLFLLVSIGAPGFGFSTGDPASQQDKKKSEKKSKAKRSGDGGSDPVVGPAGTIKSGGRDGGSKTEKPHEGQPPKSN